MSSVEHDAGDRVQAALIPTHRGSDTFDGEHPRAWLMTNLRTTRIELVHKLRPDLLDNKMVTHVEEAGLTGGSR